MQIVVISKDQPDCITPMLNTLSGHDVVLVMDRCDYGPQPCRCIKNTIGSGHMAGFARDLGAGLHDSTKPILFLDGDKIPIGDVNYLESLDFDCILLGVNNDPREWINGGEGVIPWVSKGDLMDPHNGVYSCGIYLTPKAMQIARDNCNGRIFHEIFDGNWGEEDRYLGDVLAKNGCSIGYTSKIKLTGSLTPSIIGNKKMGENWMKRLKLSNRI